MTGSMPLLTHNDSKRIDAAIERKTILNKVDNPNEHIHKWPKNTILVASDSMLSNLDERRLSKNKFNVKVRSFSGSTVSDMYFYSYPLLRKQPDYVILHVGTNDCVGHTSDQVLRDLLALRQNIETVISGVKVILSQPVSRYDGNALPSLRVQQLIRKIEHVDVPLLKNRNLVRKHGGKKGLHFNDFG